MAAYVVTRPYPGSNIGSNLASIAGALRLAQRLGRELIVDWRGMVQLRDPSLNYFTEFFERPPALLGVPISYAPVEDANYDESSSEARWLSPNEAGLLTRDPQPQERRYLVVQAYHGPDRVHFPSEAERFQFLRRFYSEIAPAPAIRSDIDAWTQQQFAGAFVVGVNVRTGNGHYFGKGQPYENRVDVSMFEDAQAFLRRIERACRRRAAALPRQLRGDFRIFYATDSEPMSGLLSQLPNAVTHRTVFPPPGTGDTFRFEDDDATGRRSVEQTVADMFLLARCDALVFNSSVFNQYARVVTGYFSGNLVHFETLSLRKRASVLASAARKRLR